MAQPFGSNLGPAAKLPSTSNLPQQPKTYKPHFPSAFKSHSPGSVRSTIPKVGVANSATDTPPIFGSSKSAPIFGGSRTVQDMFTDRHASASSSLTAEQQLWVNQMLKQAKGSGGGGLLSGIEHVAGEAGGGAASLVGQGLSATLGLLARPENAVAGLAYGSKSGGNLFAHPGRGIADAYDAFMGKNVPGMRGQTPTWYDVARKGGRSSDGSLFQNLGDLASHAGMLGSLSAGLWGIDKASHSSIFGSHALAHVGAGGLDVGSDPLNLVGGAGVWVHAGENAPKILRGLSELDKATNLSHATEATVAENLGKYQSLAKELAGYGGEHAQKLLDHLDQIVSKTANGVPAEANDISKLTMLSRAAQAEAKSGMERYLGLRLGAGEGALTLRTPIKTGLTLAGRKALADRTILGAGVRALAHVKPGYLDPVAFALENSARHQGERLSHRTLQTVLSILGDLPKDLPKNVQQKVLAVVSTHDVLNADRSVNVDVLKKILTDNGVSDKHLQDASNFALAWHSAMEHMRAAEGKAGVEYGGKLDHSSIYVPHLWKGEETAAPFIASKSGTAKQGLEKFAQKMPFGKALELHAAGKYPRHSKLVTDPMEILARRVAKSGEAISRENMRSVLRDVYAKPLRKYSRSKGWKEVDRLTARHRALSDRLSNSDRTRRLGILSAGRVRATAERAAEKAHQVRLAAFRKDLTDRRAEIKTIKDELVSTQALKGDQTRKIGQLKSKLAQKQAAYDRRVAQDHVAASEATRDAAIQKIRNKYRDDVAKTALDHEARKGAIPDQLEKLNKRISDRAAKAEKADWKKVDMPDGHLQLDTLAKNILTEDGRKIAKMHYAIPAELHDQVARVDRYLVDPAFANSVSRHMAKAMAVWKAAVTIYNPGYRVRNSISDMWNMYVSGVPAYQIPHYIAKAAHAQKQYATAVKKLTSGGVLNDAERQIIRKFDRLHDEGVLSGQFMGDVAKVEKQTYRRTGTPGWVNDKLLYGNILAENNTRIAHAMWAMDHGHSLSGAAERVRTAHFDYEALTPTEQKIKRSLIPFYTWTRKNVPYQLKMLGQNPSKFVNALLMEKQIEQASGAKPTDIIGHALDNAPTAFKLGPGYLNLQLGLNDVYNAGQPGNDALSLMNPFVKFGIEAATGHQIGGSDQAMWGPDATHQDTPAPGLLSSILSPFGLGAETSRMGPNGGTIHAPGVDNKVAFALQQIPWGSWLLAQNKVQDKVKPVTSIGGIPINYNTLSQFGGVGYIRPQAGREQAIAQIENSNAEKAYFKNLRDQGKFPAAKKPSYNSPFDKLLQEMIKRQLQGG